MKKNINRVVAAKFYRTCKMANEKLCLSFFKIVGGKPLFEHVIVEKTSPLKLIMAEQRKKCFVCVGATDFDRNENATLFTTCRMCRTEGMFNKVVATAIDFILPSTA